MTANELDSKHVSKQALISGNGDPTELIRFKALPMCDGVGDSFRVGIFIRAVHFCFR